MDALAYLKPMTPPVSNRSRKQKSLLRALHHSSSMEKIKGKKRKKAWQPNESENEALA